MKRDDRRLLLLISEYQWAFERGPSISELARILGAPRSTVTYRLKRMEARGFIRRIQNKPRRFELIAGPAPRGTLVAPTANLTLGELKRAAERVLAPGETNEST